MSKHNDRAARRGKSDPEAKLEQARQACLRKDYKTAYRLYDELLQEYPGNPNILLDYGRAKFQEFADLEQAAKLLLQAVEADPASPDALLWLAEVCSMGYGPGYEKAISLYQYVLELDPYCDDAYIGLGMLYGVPSSLVSIQDALVAYRKAAQLAPQRPDVHQDLGFALVEAGDREAAQKEFLTTIQLLTAAGRQREAQVIQADLEQLQRQEPLKRRAYVNESARFQWPE